MTNKVQKEPTVQNFYPEDSGLLGGSMKVLRPPPRKHFGGNNIESIESRNYVSGESLGVFKSNSEVRHSLDSTLVRGLVNQGVIGSGQFSTYYLYYCRNRGSCLCQFRMIERRDQYTGSSGFSILEGHSVECVHSETRTRKGEISEAEFFTKNALEVNSDKGNRGGMIIVHKGKIHRNKGKSSSEYRRFFCKEKDCSHRVIERKKDGMVCIRGFHECMTEKTPKKSAVKFYSKEECCVSVTNGHLKGGKPAKNLIANGCLFLSNRKNVLLGGRKFEDNTLANEYICQIKNQFKRNRNRDRSDFHCNAIIKERISDGSIILQGHHDPKCLHYSKKFFAPEIHGITTSGENLEVNGIRFSPLSTRSMKFGKEEISVMEYMCTCKTTYTHVNCSAVVFKHLEYETFFLTGKHDEYCMKQKKFVSSRGGNNGGPLVLPNLQIIGPPPPPPPQLLPPPPPPQQQRQQTLRLPPIMYAKENPSMPPPPTSSNNNSSGRKTRNSQKRSLLPSSRGSSRNINNNNNNNNFELNPRVFQDPTNPTNPIPELRILSVYPGIVERPGSTINILLRCPPNFSHLIRPNLFTVYFSETTPAQQQQQQQQQNKVENNNNVISINMPANNNMDNLRSEVIPRTSFYFPSIQFSDQIGNEWGVGQATCRIVVTLPFFFGLTGLLNLHIDLPSNIHLEMKNALVVSSNVDRRQNELENSNNSSFPRRSDRISGKKRKIVDLILSEEEKGGHHVARNGMNVLGGVNLGGESKICCFFPDKPQCPKVPYAEIFLNLREDEQDLEYIDVFFNDDRAIILGGYDHRFGARLTRFCKMYKSKYEEACRDSNFVVTVEVPDFIIDSSAIDLIVVLRNKNNAKKRNLVRKNIFQVNSEEVRTDPFLMTIHHQRNISHHPHHHLGVVVDDPSQEIITASSNAVVVSPPVSLDYMFNRTETPPPKAMKFGGMMFRGFDRVESLDELDSMGDL